MLVQMLPDQIAEFWDVIKYAIEQSLPPIVNESPDKMNKILSALLSGKLQCWASYENSGTNKRFEGIVVTRILYDDTSDTKSLLIYCLYGYDNVSELSWKNGFKTLIKWASSRRCGSIVGYSNVPKLLRLVKLLGGDISYTFVSLPL